MTETALERVRRRLGEVTGYVAPNGKADWLCPAHDDSTPSLSVNQGTKGVVLKCQAGCATADVLRQLGLTERDLFDGPAKSNGAKDSDIVATYDYTDETGELLFQVVRKVPKTFRQRRPKGDGSWIWGLEDTRRVLYRLPRVIEGVQRGYPIWVAEGEKDVHALERAGEIATCNPMGAGKWRDEYSRYLKGADVFIVADADEPGRDHARNVAASLSGVAASVTIFEPAQGKDAADHFAAGLTVDDLVLVTETPGAAADALPATELLKIFDAAELVRRVDSAPDVGWLAKPVWPGDAYGVLAAEQKAGKTWANLDLVVSVASGTPWLGVYPIDRPGPVLVFLGEGGERKMKRRLDAICNERGLSLGELPIRFCFRVPHLTQVAHLEVILGEVTEHQPVLMVVDPLYLAARGAKSGILNEMGEHLERLQLLAQGVGAALLIVHHWNKTGEGKGAKRMTGAGGAEWGRVLVSVSVRTKRTDTTTKASTAILDIEFEGDEIPDTELRIKRTIWAEDPDSLVSPMHYTVEQIDIDDDEGGDAEAAGFSPSTKRVLVVLRKAESWITVAEIGDQLAAMGHPLKKRTIQTALKELRKDGLARPSGDAGTAFNWCLGTMSDVDPDTGEVT